MGGVYFHIPFCKHKCLYCNFFSVADFRRREQVVAAMRDELCGRAEGWPDREVKTVYFGGGTPSLLPAEDISVLLDGVKRSLRILPGVEITLEANPDDISAEKASQWLSIGVNRLSVGVQSFDDAALAFMERRHTGADAVRAVEQLRKAGFGNITIDLIYGIPGRDDKALERDVETALALGVEHISAYALTVEKGTALDVRIGRGKLPAPDDDEAARQYFEVVDRLETAGFQRYEVSNFARPGYRSRHNSAYWSGDAYLGIGPSAHSFDGRRLRRWNEASIAKYLEGARANRIPHGEETLSQLNLRNEMVMTSLRTAEGLSLDNFKSRFGQEALESLLAQARKHIEQGLAEISEGHLRITRAGWFFTDGISSDLFEVE